jgi:hypothetical protein
MNPRVSRNSKRPGKRVIVLVEEKWEKEQERIVAEQKRIARQARERLRL